MKSGTNDFNQDVSFARQWEEIAEKQLHLFLPNTRLTRYNEYPELQRSGIDAVVGGISLTYDIKTRTARYCCHDILFETESVVEKHKPGWWHYAKCDAIVYHWLNSEQTRSQKLYILNLRKLQERGFLERVIEKLDLKPLYSNTNGGEWHTENYAVPIYEIPTDAIIGFPPLIKQFTLDDSFERQVWDIFRK